MVDYRSARIRIQTKRMAFVNMEKKKNSRLLIKRNFSKYQNFLRSCCMKFGLNQITIFQNAISLSHSHTHTHTYQLL